MEFISRALNHRNTLNLVKDAGAVRIGVLGAAMIAPTALLVPAGRMTEAVVVAIAARDKNRAQKMADKYKIPKVFGNYDELIADPDIDAIFIPLPNSLHAQWAIKALSSGKHVLCEKPIASNQYEAQQMSEASKQSGKVLVEAFHYKYHPAAIRLKEILTSGEIGKITKVEAVGHLPSLFFSANDIRFNFDLAGGSVMDFGCYFVNILRFIVGEEPEVTKSTATLYKPEIDDRMISEFSFPSGCTASVDITLRAWMYKTSVRIIGEEGEIALSGFPVFSMLHSITVKNNKTGKSRTEKCYGEGESTYWYQLKAFVKAVKGQPEACPTTPEDAILNMKVIDDMYMKAGLSMRGKRAPQNTDESK